MESKELLRTPGIRKHRAGLDGFRGLAVLLVVAHHYLGLFSGIQIFWWGWIGVDFFFVLSGFLITRGLWASLGEIRYFQDFYWKRALRIFPLYYGFWLLLLVLGPLLRMEFHWSLLGWPLYIGNFIRPYWVAQHQTGLNNVVYFGHGLRLFGHTISGRASVGVGQFWSLCVEEQFYLIWPALIYLLRDKRKIRTFCLIGLIVEPLLRASIFWLVPDTRTFMFFYYETYARLDGLFLGALLAVQWDEAEFGNAQQKLWGRRLLACGAAGFALSAAVGQFVHHIQWGSWEPVSLSEAWINLPGYTFVALIGGGLLLESLREDSPLARFFRIPWLGSVGVVSYGLYFFHMFPMEKFLLHREAFGHWRPLISIALFFVMLGVAKLSFRFYETPFLKLKAKLHHFGKPQRA